jgi:glycosyltransferase involved in cell wall biosynthesis
MPNALTAKTRASIVWVGGYPSHYIRNLHNRIEEKYPNRVHFVYLGVSEYDYSQRAYESGRLPQNCIVIEPGNFIKQSQILIKELRYQNPMLVVTAGHFPRPICIAALWGHMKGCYVCYWSDTNLNDTLVKSWPLRIIKKFTLRFYLKKMDRLLYIGSNNKAFYSWCLDHHLIVNHLIRFPYPHDHNMFCRKDEEGGNSIRAMLGLNDQFTILYLGRLVAYKGVDLLIRALALLPKKLQTSYHCLIAGDGPCRSELETLVKSIGIQHMVSFLGAIPSGETLPLYAATDVLILPSHLEAWGIVVNEALSSKKPVVAPRWVGSVADLVIDGVTGIVIADNSPKNIATALVKLFSDREATMQMGLQGSDLIRKKSWTVEGALDGWAHLIQLTAGTDLQ